MFRFSLLFLAQTLLFTYSHEIVSASLKPMNYEDIVFLEKPTQTAVSSRNRIAFAIQRADIDKNSNVESVYIYDIANQDLPQKLWDLDKVERLFWRQDVLYVLGKKNENYQILSFAHEPRTFLSTSNLISACTVDAPRSILYYTQIKYVPETVVQRFKEEGYVYRWGKDHAWLVMGEKRYAYPESEQIWCLDVSTGRHSLVTELDHKDWNSTYSLVEELHVSEDGNHLVILANRTGRPELGESVGGPRDTWVWSQKEQALNQIQSKARIISNPLTYDDKTIYLQTVDENHSTATYIVEDPNTPPQVVMQNKNNGQVTYLTSLNPQLETTSRGYVEPIEVVTEDQRSVKGYLVHPVNQEAGKRYPLIIATYGFSGKKFIADAEWHSSFPAQVLANEGYYVLLLRHCGLAQNLVGDSQKARDIEGWNVLKTFERAIDLLDEQGVIDPEKVGIYGWSHGAFMVGFLISHSNKFQVACLGEGGDYGPSCFFLSGMNSMQKICENIYGGPPWGETLKNYIEFSTLFGVDRIKAPVLMEFVGGFVGIVGLELYAPLRYLNIPAELILYDGEEHNFVKPKARMASMARKVDWFNFWLLDKHNPEKPEQNARWQEMKESSRA